jgi:hypothetical protein
MRSPIRSGGVKLKDCSIRIGWPFFGDFFWPPKKSLYEKGVSVQQQSKNLAAKKNFA